METQKKSALFVVGVCLVVLAAVIVVFIIVTNFFTWSRDFKTQTIIFRSTQDRQVRIEFQMSDHGALGYGRRIVKVTPGFWGDNIKEIDTAKIDKRAWDRVDEEVNELGLKYP